MSVIVAIKVIILGIIEGLTEYIPVSSTGHLIVFGDLLQFDAVPEKMFEITIQLGAILAILVLYRKRLINILLNFLHDTTARNFVINMIIAVLPAVIIGILAYDFIKEFLFSSSVVAYSLIIGGVIMIVVDKINFNKKYLEVEDVTKKTALKIGLFQCLAMIPGMSRSGATIIGGVSLGLSKKAAAEFSFFLALPTIFGATIFDIIKNGNSFMDYYIPISLGFVTAFLTGLVIISQFIVLIRKFGFAPFGYYRIILGAVILYLIA